MSENRKVTVPVGSWRTRPPSKQPADPGGVPIIRSGSCLAGVPRRGSARAPGAISPRPEINAFGVQGACYARRQLGGNERGVPMRAPSLSMPRARRTGFRVIVSTASIVGILVAGLVATPVSEATYNVRVGCGTVRVDRLVRVIDAAHNRAASDAKGA